MTNFDPTKSIKHSENYSPDTTKVTSGKGGIESQETVKKTEKHDLSTDKAEDAKNKLTFGKALKAIGWGAIGTGGAFVSFTILLLPTAVGYGIRFLMEKLASTRSIEGRYADAKQKLEKRNPGETVDRGAIMAEAEKNEISDTRKKAYGIIYGVGLILTLPVILSHIALQFSGQNWDPTKDQKLKVGM